MRVCILGLRGIPNVAGGVETHCEHLFPRLRARRPNDQFDLIARRAYMESDSFLYQGIRITSLPHARNKHLEALSNSVLAVVYARFSLRAQLLHIHAIGPSLVAPLAKLLGMKVVVTHHGTDYNRAKWNRVAKALLRLGEFCAIQFGNEVIAVSPSLERHLKGKYPKRAEKVRFIPNGASDLDPAVPECEHVLSKHNLKAQKYVVSVGRLVPEKGFHDLISAFKEANLDSKLVIVGGAMHDDEYYRTLAREADHRVVFTGFLKRNEVAVLLENASLFVLPSYHEGLPIVALEAGIAGVPVLLSDIEPNRDLGFQSRNYFNVGNLEDLRRCLAEPHEYFAVDRADIAARYDWDNICSQTDEVYNSMASQIDSPRAAAKQHARSTRFNCVRAWVGSVLQRLIG